MSYGSSPPAEVLYAEKPIDTPPTAVIESTCFRQTEYVGALRGTRNPQLAAQLISYLLDVPFQESMPLDAAPVVELTKDIEKSLNDAMYNVHEKEHHQLFHFIKRNFLNLLVDKSKSEKFEFEKVKQLSEKINNNDAALSTLKTAANSYMRLLSQHKLREKYVRKYMVHAKFIGDYLIFLFLIIPSIPGLVFNSWPYFMAVYTVK